MRPWQSDLHTQPHGFVDEGVEDLPEMLFSPGCITHTEALSVLTRTALSSTAFCCSSVAIRASALSCG